MIPILALDPGPPSPLTLESNPNQRNSSMQKTCSVIYTKRQNISALRKAMPFQSVKTPPKKRPSLSADEHLTIAPVPSYPINTLLYYRKSGMSDNKPIHRNIRSMGGEVQKVHGHTRVLSAESLI